MAANHQNDLTLEKLKIAERLAIVETEVSGVKNILDKIDKTLDKVIERPLFCQKEWQKHIWFTLGKVGILIMGIISFFKYIKPNL